MTILHDFTRPVKSARSRSFGLGLGMPGRERMPVGPSDDDRRWAAYHLNAGCTDYDVLPDYEALASEAEAVDRMSSGHAIF